MGYLAAELLAGLAATLLLLGERLGSCPDFSPCPLQDCCRPTNAFDVRRQQGWPDGWQASWRWRQALPMPASRPGWTHTCIPLLQPLCLPAAAWPGPAEAQAPTDGSTPAAPAASAGGRAAEISSSIVLAVPTDYLLDGSDRSECMDMVDRRGSRGRMKGCRAAGKGRRRQRDCASGGACCSEEHSLVRWCSCKSLVAFTRR